MLSFHAAMDMIESQFEGDVWKFASHFRRYKKHDLQRTHIRGMVKTLPVYNLKLVDFNKRFITALLGKRWRRRRRYKKKKKECSSSSSSSSFSESSDSGDEVGDMEPRTPSNCLHNEYFFQPVVFSWTDDKCCF